MATSDNRRDEIIFRGTYENILDTEGAEIFCNDFYILYDFLRRFPVDRHFPIFHLVQCPVCLSFLLTDVVRIPKIWEALYVMDQSEYKKMPPLYISITKKKKLESRILMKKKKKSHSLSM